MFIKNTLNKTTLNEIKGLKLVQRNAGGNRGFQVETYPQGEKVYWSFSRKSANDFIKKYTTEYNLKVLFDSSVETKSIDYDYRYDPIEYLLGAIAIMVMLSVVLAFCFSQVMDNPATIAVFGGFLLFGLHMLKQYFSAKKNHASKF